MAGRPSEYTPEINEKAKAWIEAYEAWYDVPTTYTNKKGTVKEVMQRKANKPPFVSDLIKHLNLSRSTFYDWVKKHSEFSDTIKKRLNEKYEEILVENGLLGKYAPAFAIFTAKNKLGWTDRAENTIKFPKPLVIQDENGKELMKLGFESGSNQTA